MNNSHSNADKSNAIGPRTITTLRQTCEGCSALALKDWRFLGENDELDIGTSAKCTAAADKPINSYWNERTPTPEWCPVLPPISTPTGEGGALHNACEPWSFHTGEPPEYNSPLSGVFGAGMAYTESLLAKLLNVSSYEGGDGSEDFDCDATMTLVNILAGAGLYDKDECQPITVTLAHPQQGGERDGWKPISEARHDCTLYELEVPSDGKGLRDAETSITIGSNNGDHDGEDRWTYAGWSWCQDRYIHMDTADGAPMPIRFREIRPDHLGRSASEPDPAVSPGNGHHLSYSGKPMPPDGIDGCVYCGQPFKEGDLVLSEVEGGEGHVTCMGPERDSYVGADGEPLRDDEPIPTGRPWIPTSPSKSSEEEA